MLWCDWELSEYDRKRPVDQGDALRGIDLGAGPRDLDICTECQDTLTWRQVETLYIKEGRPVGSTGQEALPVPRYSSPKFGSGPSRGTSETAKDQPCPWCKVQLDNVTGTRKHLWDVHGLDVRNIQPKCPLCDQVNINTGEAFKSQQGVSLHCYRAHGVSYMRALVKAKRNGDPYGVIAHAEALMKRK